MGKKYDKKAFEYVVLFLPKITSFKTWGKSFQRFKGSLHRPSKFLLWCVFVLYECKRDY